MKSNSLRRSLAALFTELIDGSASEAWMLNPGDPGLLRSLDMLSATDASRVPAGGGSSIAAHVDHLRYGLSLLNRWSQGEQNAFADADYAASWRRTTVSGHEWSTLRQQLRDEARRWQEALQESRDVSQTELNAVIGSIAHLAYHLGAIRQIDRATRGPTAGD